MNNQLGDGYGIMTLIGAIISSSALGYMTNSAPTGWFFFGICVMLVALVYAVYKGVLDTTSSLGRWQNNSQPQVEGDLPPQPSDQGGA